MLQKKEKVCCFIKSKETKEKELPSEDKVVLGSAAVSNTEKKWSGKRNGHKSFIPRTT